MVCIARQLDQAELISFISIGPGMDNRYENLEIFDISKGEVFKRVKSNSFIEKEAISYLRGITGMYSKVNAIPDKGYIIRIPFDSPQKIQNKWLKNYNITYVKEVFIILHEKEKPYLLVLDDKSRPFFYDFEGDTDNLINYINNLP